MCGPPCAVCGKHVYAHAPERHHATCLDCYVTAHPDQATHFVKNKEGKWDFKDIKGTKGIDPC